jgi:chemosensory pili system protein ChpC
MTTRLRSVAPAAEVRGLIAPTTQGSLLLPSAAVAEVVAYSGDVRVHKAGPPWFLGQLDWRGQRAPLIDLGIAGGDMAPTGDARARWRRPCVLVCFSLNGNRALPYIGFLVADSPRLVRIRPGDLVQQDIPEKVPLVLYGVELQGRSAWVPDLDDVESQVLALGLHG